MFESTSNEQIPRPQTSDSPLTESPHRNWDASSPQAAAACTPVHHFAFYPVLPPSFQSAAMMSVKSGGGEDSGSGPLVALSASADLKIDDQIAVDPSASAITTTDGSDDEEDDERPQDDAGDSGDDAKQDHNGPVTVAGDVNMTEVQRLQKEIEDAQQKAFERFMGLPGGLRVGGGFPMTPSLLAALQNPFASLNNHLLLAAGITSGSAIGAGSAGVTGVTGLGMSDASLAFGNVPPVTGGSPEPVSDQPEDLSVNSSTKKEGSDGGGAVNSPSGGDNESQQTWSYEEQFKQLYELSDEPKRKEWLDEWLGFMHRIGKPVTRIPIMAKQVLDLYELYRLVVQHGGLVEIINKKLWREITKGLNLPSSITSAAFTLRTQYQKYLYDFECEKESLSTPADLQLAIEGNRREGRRNNSSGFNPYPSLISHHHHHQNNAVANAAVNKHHLNGPGSAVTAAQILGRSFSGASTSDDDNSAANMAAAIQAATGGLMGMAGAGPAAAQQAVLAAYRAEQVAAMEAQRHMEQARRAAADSLQRQINIVTNQQHPQASGRTSTSSNDSDGGDSGNHIEQNNNGEPPAAKRPRLLGNGGSSNETVTNMATSVNHLLNGMPSAHLKITSKAGESKLNSLVVSMEIDGVMYQGVLYASLSPGSQTPTPGSTSTAPPPAATSSVTPLQINTGLNQ